MGGAGSLPNQRRMHAHTLNSHRASSQRRPPPLQVRGGNVFELWATHICSCTSLSTHTNTQHKHKQTAGRQPLQQQSEFAKKASQIGLSISKTSAKLHKLAQLAKRTSMFDDPTAEIDELTGILKQDIQALNAAIAELQRVSSRRGGGGGEEAPQNKQSADHSHTVVDSLRARLKDATLEFKDVLTLRTENIKVHQERRQLFSSQPDAGAYFFVLFVCWFACRAFL